MHLKKKYAEQAIGLPQFNIYEITWEQVKDFCSKCESYKEREFCHVGKVDQPRYVARGYCGYAHVGGQFGKMFNNDLSEGSYFKPQSKI